MYSKIYDFYTAEGSEPISYFRVSFLNYAKQIITWIAWVPLYITYSLDGNF